MKKRDIEKMAMFDNKYYTIFKEIYLMGFSDGFNLKISDMLFHNGKLSKKEKYK